MANQHISHASDDPSAPEGAGGSRDIELVLRRLLSEGEPGSDVSPDPPVAVSESFALRLYERLRGSLPEGDLSFPCRFGKYELLDELGRGGMGVIYKARDTELDRVVALKRILTGRFASAAEVARFGREARAAAALDHRCIVPIYEVDSFGGHEFFAMKLLEGGSLLERSTDLARSTHSIADLMERIARAVAYAHERGILHRDLKRANILFDADDQPYVVDFGLARHLDTDPSLTASGGLVGTLRYLPPEVVSGAALRPSTSIDIYGIGVILYELLAGRPPFSEDSSSDLLRQIREDEPVPPSRFRADVHRDLETICLRCLEKDPGARYGTTAAVAEELARVRRNEPILARRAGTGERLWKWATRRRAAAALAVLSSLIALTIPVLGIWHLADLRRQARELSREKEVARRYMYAARLNLAAEAWKDGLYHRGQEILNSLEPAAGETDLRSFGWRFLHNTMTPERWSVLAHAGEVCDVQFLPGGDRLASASLDGRLRLWDTASGELLAEDALPRRSTVWSYFSPDGRFAARCLGGDKLEFQVAELLRDSKSGRWRVTLDYAHEVSAAGFSRDGRLAGTTSDGTLLFWDTESWEITARIPFRRLCWEIRFSPDGRTLAANDDGGRLRLFDVLHQRPLSHREIACFTAAFSPEWRYAAVKPAEDAPLEIHDPRTWECLSRLSDAPPSARSMSFSPDGRTLAVGAGESPPRVEIWDLERPGRGEILYGGFVTSMAFSEDGTALVTGSTSGEVKLWDLPPAARPFRHQTSEGRYEEVAVAGDLVVVSRRGFSFEALRIRPPRSRTLPLQPVGVLSFSGGGLADEALAPSGHRVALSRVDGRVEFHSLWWDAVPRSEMTATLRFPEEVAEMAFVSDDALLVAEAQGTVTRWELEDTLWRETSRLKHHERTVTGLYPSPDRRAVVVATAKTPDLFLCDLESGRTRAMRGHAGPVYAVAFSPDGKWMASGSRDCQVIEWDVSDWRTREGISPTRVLRGHTNAIGGLVFFGDGETLASASDDRTIKLWDLTTGAEKATFAGHNYHINALARAADGSVLVSVGGHRKRRIGELLLWSAMQGEVR